MFERQGSPIRVLDRLKSVDPELFAIVSEAVKDDQEPKQTTFTIRHWGDMLNLKLPPRVAFFGEVFCLGQLLAIQGPPGVGKSRIALNIARNQVLGLPWCGMSTGQKPLKHLLLGNENSSHRIQRDMRAMTSGLSPEQTARLQSHIWVQSLETPDDCFINLGDNDVVARWEATVMQVQPDVLWADPWGEIQTGDPNNDLDTRGSLRKLVQTVRHANPDMAIVLLHHSRTGRQNIAQATGWDRGNYGKGSKALYSGARAVINLAPGDETPGGRVVVACGKVNDARPFDTFCARLNDQTSTYDLDGDFDEDAWKADVEGKRSNAAVSIQDIVNAVADGVETKTDLVAYFTADDKVGKSSVYRALDKALGTGFVTMSRGKLRATSKAKPRVSPEPDPMDIPL